MPNRPQPRIAQALFLAGSALWLMSKPRRPRHALLWSALGFAADLIAIPLILRAKPPIEASELAALHPERLTAIDRIALNMPAGERKGAQKISDNILRFSVAVPLALLLLRRRPRMPVLDYVWGHALTYTLYTFGPFGPAFADKFRPIVYRSEVPADERSNGNNRNSQYSGHTGSAAFAGVFLAREIARENTVPATALLTIAIAPAALVGGLRVRAQKHFPTDVALAVLIGAAIALVFSRPIGNRSVIRA